MVIIPLPRPGSIIELTPEQKEELSGNVIGFKIEENLFLFNQERFNELFRLKLSEIDNPKIRRGIKQFAHSQAREVKELRAPNFNKSQKRMLVTV